VPLFFSRQDFARLAWYMESRGDGRMADIARFAVATGGRLGELCQLAFGDVDPDSGLVHYRASGQLLDGREKTNKSLKDRAVPLVPMARAVYAHQLERYPSPNVPPNAALFWGVRGGPLTSGSFTSHKFKRYVRELAEREEDFSSSYDFHTLRHTFASWLRLAGVPLDRIQYWLGHASIVTTEKYAHIVPESIQRESEVVFPELRAADSVGIMLDTHF
jgi:integrase